MLSQLPQLVRSKLIDRGADEILFTEAREIFVGMQLPPAVQAFVQGADDEELSDVLDRLARAEIPEAEQRRFSDDLLAHLDSWIDDLTEPPPPARSSSKQPVPKRALALDPLDDPELQGFLDRGIPNAIGGAPFREAQFRSLPGDTVRYFLTNAARDLAPRYHATVGQVERAQSLVLSRVSEHKSRVRQAQEAEAVTLAEAAEIVAAPPVREVLDRLASLRAALRGEHPIDGSVAPRFELQRQEHPPAFAAFIRSEREPHDRRMLFDMRGGSESATVTEGGTYGDVDQPAASLQALYFIDAIVNRLRDDPWAQNALIEPPWRRVLSLLDGILDQPNGPREEGQILSWRLHPDGTNIRRLEIFVHKPNKRGYSAGALTDPMRISTKQIDLLPQDAQAMPSAREAHFDRAQLYATLLALEGHPRVFLADDPTTPVSIHHAAFGLALLDEETCFRVSVALDGTPIAPHAVDEYLIHVEGRRVLLAKLDAQQQALSVALRGYGTVPITAEAREPLLERLHRLEASLPVALPPALRGDAVPANPAPFARAGTRGGVLELQLCVRPIAFGLAFGAGEGPLTVSAMQDGVRVHAVRDFAEERRQANAVAAPLGIDEDRAFHYVLTDSQRALDVLVLLRDSQIALEWLEGSRQARITSGGTLRVSVREGKDWFKLDGELSVDQERIELALVLDAARRGQRYVQLSDDSWLALEASMREQLVALDAFAHEAKGELQVGLPALAALDGLEALGAEVNVPTRWVDLRKRMQESPPAEVPEQLAATLRSYQEEGFRWLMQLAEWGVGGVLADDMGLGKTVQALAVMVARKGPTLVLAPTSVCFNWVAETRRFAPTLEVSSYERGPVQAQGVIIASYGALTRNIDHFKAHRFSTVVFDEAHALKNADAQRTRAARSLQFDWAFALTGTPVENRLGELWSLFHVLSPGLLGSSDHFRERFVLPIERDKDPKRRQALARLVKPFILRRTKAVVAPELPPKTEIDVPIVLSPEERTLYDDARLSAEARIGRRTEENRFELLAALTRLRLLVCHPKLYDPATLAQSAKLTTFMRLVEELRANRHRALVFSQFTKHLAIVRAALDAAGITYQYLDGQTPKAEREKRVTAFQQGSGTLFLISVQAGGTGLNLTAADYVVHLDPWWNPAVEDQATGRAHRIGQDKPVTVYRLFAKNTIEERILELHRDKRDLVASVLDEAHAADGKLSVDELFKLAFGSG